MSSYPEPKKERTRIRYERMVALREAGQSVDDIAVLFGVVADTVRAIIRERAPELIGDQRQRGPSDSTLEIGAAYLDDPEASLRDIAERYGLSRERVRQCAATVSDIRQANGQAESEPS